MSLVNLIDLPFLGDERGGLVAIEANELIPFDIKRVYYIFDTKQGIARGFHAHKALKQVAVCLSGNCKMVLDNGRHKEDVWLDSPTKGVMIDTMVWREMYDFSPDCILLVLASHHYNEEDYIRDYKYFLNQIEK